jgi:transcriptional regulator with XRE-family HTH domain
MPDRALPPDAGIGERLRRLRANRGVTQEELAALAGVSVDLIKKLEQGRRQSARLTSLARLTDALDVPLSQLTDKHPRLGGDSDALVLGLRDALLTPTLLPGFDADDDGVATPLPQLAAALGRAGPGTTTGTAAWSSSPAPSRASSAKRGSRTAASVVPPPVSLPRHTRRAPACSFISAATTSPYWAPSAPSVSPPTATTGCNGRRCTAPTHGH